MEGLEVRNRYSTSYGINTENSWKDAIEGGNFASIGCSIKAMFKRLRSARMTGNSSCTKLSKRGTTSIYIYKPTFIWQLYLYGVSSERTLIISKTNIYRQTTSNRPPRPYLSSQTDSDGKSLKDDMDDNVKVIEDDTGSENSEQNVGQLTKSETVSPLDDESQGLKELQDISQHDDDSDEHTTADKMIEMPDKDDTSNTIPTLERNSNEVKEEN